MFSGEGRCKCLQTKGDHPSMMSPRKTKKSAEMEDFFQTQKPTSTRNRLSKKISDVFFATAFVHRNWRVLPLCHPQKTRPLVQGLSTTIVPHEKLSLIGALFQGRGGWHGSLGYFLDFQSKPIHGFPVPKKYPTFTSQGRPIGDDIMGILVGVPLNAKPPGNQVLT